jgi:hypothetical protein
MTRAPKQMTLGAIIIAGAVSAALAGGSPVAKAGPPPPSACPLVKTISKNFSFGPNTGTVTMNLYASATYGSYGCFNGYERVYVSSGSGVFGSLSAGDSWIQFWTSTDGGKTWVEECGAGPGNQSLCNANPTECFSFGYGVAVSGFLLSTGPSGQCSTTNFTWPRNSFAWVQQQDFIDSGYGFCMLIQNLANSGDGVDNQVWSNTNRVAYNLPNETLEYCDNS